MLPLLHLVAVLVCEVRRTWTLLIVHRLLKLRSSVEVESANHHTEVGLSFDRGSPPYTKAAGNRNFRTSMSGTCGRAALQIIGKH